MRSFFTLHRTIIILGALIVVAAGSYWLYAERTKAPTWVTDTVSRGTVENIIGVSGVVAAENTAHLAFPISGIIADIYVSEGDSVNEGDVLATLEQASLAAEREDALGALRIAEADRDELVTGPRSEARDVTAYAVTIAQDALDRTIREESAKVENARRTLLSDDLEALPENKDSGDVPPTISGTYTCTTEGTYTLTVFRSSAKSGYAYRLSGLESGTYTAYTESPAPLGTCGLMIQFDADELYAPQDWTITIPNTRSSSYASNYNAYILAEEQQKNAIDAQQQALEKARRDAILENAAPRTEEITRAEARITQAAARLKEIEARIAERTLRAPFTGTVNNIEAIAGENVGTTPVITIVASNKFELTVRIPEIDITKVAIEQEAQVIFDARTSETVPARITFISPLATIIDGVAYFEAILHFDTPPPWLRGGLNADVNIIIDRKENVLRIPKRFLITEGDTAAVLIPSDTTAMRTPVEIRFTGNNGFVEISGLNEGDTIIAP